MEGSNQSRLDEDSVVKEGFDNQSPKHKKEPKKPIHTAADGKLHFPEFQNFGTTLRTLSMISIYRYTLYQHFSYYLTI